MGLKFKCSSWIIPRQNKIEETYGDNIYVLSETEDLETYESNNAVHSTQVLVLISN